MKKYLIALDFDGTLASTFEPSPQGIGVNEAYTLAVRDVLGPEGLAAYGSDRIGGLKNRAPCELVRDILHEGDTSAILAHAREFLDKNRAILELEKYVPDGKGVPLVWDETNPESTITELLVWQKLKYLLEQVGTTFPDGSIWPAPCEGFQDFWRELQALKDEGGIPLDTVIISSAHDGFIQKIFDTWNLPYPDYMVTEDDIRGRKYPLNMAMRVKPGQLPMTIARLGPLRDQGIVTTTLENGRSHTKIAVDDVRDTKDRLIYFGDDQNKDGGLAERTGIPFGLFKSGAEYKIHPDSSQITFGDWKNITNVLRQNASALRVGRPIKEIFFGAFQRIITDLSKVPDISGAWECASRKMHERNPGDSAEKGIVEVNPPDPRTPGGRMVIEIIQNGRTYTSRDLVNATHEHDTKGFYTGNGTFAFTTTRVADDNKAPRMTLNGAATLIDDNTLKVTVVGAEGGNPAPHPDRDPPPGYSEERIYRRKNPVPVSSSRA
jgi:hypothetical protein